MTDSIKLQYEKIEIFTTEWIDITSYVVKDIDSEWGIAGNSIIDRTAQTGDYSITLNNASGLFTIGSPDALTGFDRGIYIRYTVGYDDRPFVKFYGRIADIEPIGGTVDSTEISVTAVDWMDSLAKFKMEGFQLYANKKANEGIQLIINEMPVAPLTSELAIGEDTFPTIFDTVKDGTKGLSEVTKLVLSELGWAYLRRDRATGEKFVFESRTTRDSIDRSKVPLLKSLSGFLKLESGGYLLKEDGGKLILDEVSDFTFEDNMISASVKYGDNLINDLSIISYPRRVDTSLQVLYETSERIPLLAGETKSNFKVSYKDPNGGNLKVNTDPSTMVTPDSSDKSMTLNADGTGTDLSANLVVTPSFSVEGVTFSIQNTGATDGYVWLRFRGYGIYTQEPITYNIKNTTSISDYDSHSLSIPQPYQNDPTISQGVANFALNARLNPTQDLESISFIANYSQALMGAFLYFDVGDKVYVKVTKRNIDAEYFIQKIKYKITPGGLIYVTYYFTDSLSVSGRPWLLGIPGRTELGLTTIIGF